MDYIVFDLEWNQCCGGREFEEARMPFEIIEIGAVRLDKKFNLIDQYSSIIKPRLYKRLQPHIREILSYDEKTLKKGRPFDMVCREFFKWCNSGGDYSFVTWGPMDLNYLQNNMEYYHMKPLETPLKFYNLQKIYADVQGDELIAKLETAVNTLGIESDRPYHSALNDAYYTGNVLKKLHPSDFEDRYSFDIYNNPKEKEEEIISYHKNYMEHISMEYNSKKEAMSDKDLLNVKCYKCNRKTSKKIKWFANTPNSYVCVCKCWYHGYISAKIKFKQSKDNKIFVIKTVTPENKKGVEAIRERQIELREKRQEKRHNRKKTAS